MDVWISGNFIRQYLMENRPVYNSQLQPAVLHESPETRLTFCGTTGYMLSTDQCFQA